jgi:hypothetical protein
VIEAGSTGSGVQDSGSVGLEGGAVSFDKDGDGLLVKSGLNGIDVLSLSHLVALGLNSGTSTVVSARSVLTGVRVGVLKRGGGSLVVVEGDVLPSSLASMVLGGAIDELLLSEREERSGLDEVSAFHGHVGGEGPARSALSLVLNSVDSSLGSPVDAVGGAGRVRAGAGSTTVSTGLLAVSGHEGVGVSGAPSLLGPLRALVVQINACGLGRSRVALVARLLTVGDHVTGVSVALTSGSPGGARSVAINARRSDFLGGLLGCGEESSSEHGLVLRLSEVTHVVVVHGPGFAGVGVVSPDSSVSEDEESTSEDVLSDGREVSSVLCNPVLELGFKVGSNGDLSGFSTVGEVSGNGNSGDRGGDK